jgi:hypothetical protein
VIHLKISLLLLLDKVRTTLTIILLLGCVIGTFRYSTEGFGLIQLHFGGLKSNKLTKSFLSHVSKKGAYNWEGINTLEKNVSTLDYKEIEKTSRKLKYIIHNKLAIRKIGSFGIIPEAEMLLKNGIQLS